MQTIDTYEVRTKILSGQSFDEEFQVVGELDLSGISDLIALPAQLRQAWGVNLAGCTELKQLPDNLQVHRLNVNDCIALKTFPVGLVSHSILAQRSGLSSLPDDIQVAYKLDLTDCKALQNLPDKFQTGSLIIRGCSLLEAMPDGLSLYFLDASNCNRLKKWGETGRVEVGNITLAGCTALTYLPDWMDKVAQLNILGCTSLRHLPNGLIVTTVIELADSGLVELPYECSNTQLRWRDVIVNERIVFHPEQITAAEVMGQNNIELRRVLLERMGYEAFFNEANAVELNRDVDPGGMRRLLRVDFQARNRWEQEEPVVCLSVICPSTARQYIIRVPPNMETCHQAASRVAGFDDPNLYHPVQET